MRRLWQRFLAWLGPVMGDDEAEASEAVEGLTAPAKLY